MLATHRRRLAGISRADDLKDRRHPVDRDSAAAEKGHSTQSLCVGLIGITAARQCADLPRTVHSIMATGAVSAVGRAPVDQRRVAAAGATVFSRAARPASLTGSSEPGGPASTPAPEPAGCEEGVGQLIRRFAATDGRYRRSLGRRSGVSAMYPNVSRTHAHERLGQHVTAAQPKVTCAFSTVQDHFGGCCSNTARSSGLCIRRRRDW
jgi:hypothetical protein